MASHRAHKTVGRSRLVSTQGIEPRRSARLTKGNKDRESKQRPIPLVAEENRAPPLPPQSRKRKIEHLAHYIPTDQPTGPSRTKALHRSTASCLSASQFSHISGWVQEGHVWPRDFFEEDRMLKLLARDRSSTGSLRRKWSGLSTVTPATPSDQKPREEKSIPYNHPGYQDLLKNEGIYMEEHDLGITGSSKGLCQTLLSHIQSLPDNSIFRDDIFQNACKRLQGKNEARIIQDISRLIVPSAETLAICGANHLNVLVESVNEGWNNSIPITATRPQPDYAVGFRPSAFSEDQLNKLQPYLGGIYSLSYFKATYYMLFPFLTCEVKCGETGLDAADRQNAHSAALAVRAVVELFKGVKREKELDREILAFSVSHDNQSVRIYGYHPVVVNTETTIWRHPIRQYNFTELNGRDKWAAYSFTKNLYDIWVPAHLKRISSALDDISPDMGLESNPQISESPGPLQQELDGASELSHADLQQVTPDTPPQPAPKKKKKV